jgi:hypothetical protein
MTHPDESVLVDYMDGALATDAAATVRDHVSTCSRCRAEVEAAGRASTALRSLGELAAPAGIASEAMRQAKLGGEQGPAAEPIMLRRKRISRLVTVGVAAVLIVVAGVGLAKVARHPAPQIEAGTGALRTPASEFPYDKDGNYSPSELAALASRFAGKAPNLALGGPALGQVATGASTSPSMPASNSQPSAVSSPVPAPTSGSEHSYTQKLAAGQVPPLGTGTIRLAPGSAAWAAAKGCVTRAGIFKGVSASLKALLSARFEGQPALIAIVYENPKLGQPPDRVVVWAVSRQGCAVLSFAQSML